MRVASLDADELYGLMRIGEKIRARRDLARLSQEELAERVGVAQSTLGRWEAGTGEPKLRQALALARALGVSLDYLADDALDEPPPATEERSEADAIILRLAKGVGYEQAAERLQITQKPPFAVPPPDTPPDAR
jgi:transcriptional regulator with XRE-family HTH domain